MRKEIRRLKKAANQVARGAIRQWRMDYHEGGLMDLDGFLDDRRDPLPVGYCRLVLDSHSPLGGRGDGVILVPRRGEVWTFCTLRVRNALLRQRRKGVRRDDITAKRQRD